MANKTWPSAPGANRGAQALRGLRTQMDTLFEDWFGRSMGGMLAPRVDMSETDQEVTLAVELPGVQEKDVTVSLTGNQITIKGEKKAEHEDQQDQHGRTFHRIERSYGAFERTMAVPYRIDPEQVTAQFKDGILRITLPKPADAVGRLQARQIPITRAEPGGA